MKIHVLASEDVDAKSLRDLRATQKTLSQVARVVVKEIRETVEWARVCRILKSPPQCLSICYCTDAEMRSYQKKYRKLDRTTDVLSFPTFEIPEVAEIQRQIPPSERSLGDLIVSIPTVVRGAKRGHRSPREEHLEVFIHGILHLAGLDHVGVSPIRRKRMMQMQRDLYARCLRLIN